MNNLRLGLWTSSLVLSIACVPMVSTYSTPRGPKISADCIKVGEDTMVSLSVARKEDSPTWQAKFINETPNNLTIEDIPGNTIIRWKVEKERIKSTSINPYKLNLTQGDESFLISVQFRTNLQQIGGEVVWQGIVNFLVHL